MIRLPVIVVNNDLHWSFMRLAYEVARAEQQRKRVAPEYTNDETRHDVPVLA